MGEKARIIDLIVYDIDMGSTRLESQEKEPNQVTLQAISKLETTLIFAKQCNKCALLRYTHDDKDTKEKAIHNSFANYG